MLLKVPIMLPPEYLQPTTNHQTMGENFLKFLETTFHLPPTQFEEIHDLVRIQEFVKGDFLINQGDSTTEAYFIEKGLVKMYSLDTSGKEHILQFACENWLVLERSSMYFDEPSFFYVEAIENTTAVGFGQDLLDRLHLLQPLSIRTNEILLQNHIRHLQYRIHMLLSASAEERYLEFIRLYPDLTLRVPQWMIASYLGITPESLSRVRKALAYKNFKPHNK